MQCLPSSLWIIIYKEVQMRNRSRFFVLLCGATLLFVQPGCGCLGWTLKRTVKPRVDNLSDGLEKSLVMQKDVALTREGAPAYLLLIDGLIESYPESEGLLLIGSRMMSAYASAFLVDDEPERARIMLDKALDYGLRGLSQRSPEFEKVKDGSFDEFDTCLPTFEKEDVPALFTVAYSWAWWILARMDFFAFSDMPKVKSLFERIIELDETHYYGASHVVMGLLYSFPEVQGGNPEKGKAHFERALEIGEGKFLLAPVLYAKKYARLVYDRELHDRLLQKVLETPVDIDPEVTLMNTNAQNQARELLDSADDYF